jgi:hypothetical protein
MTKGMEGSAQEKRRFCNRTVLRGSALGSLHGTHRTTQRLCQKMLQQRVLAMEPYRLKAQGSCLVNAYTTQRLPRECYSGGFWVIILNTAERYQN